MNTSISVEVSPGELIDKITILEVKLERIKDADKLANVKLDWETLSAARDAAIEPSGELERLSAELKQANERLWRIEDDIRDCERNKDFGDAFVERQAQGCLDTGDAMAWRQPPARPPCDMGAHLVEQGRVAGKLGIIASSLS